MAVLFPLSIWLLRRVDVRIVLVIGLIAFAAAALLCTQNHQRMAAHGLHPHRAAAMRRADLHASSHHFDRALQFRSDPGDRIRRLYPDHASRRRRNRDRADGTWLRVREQVHSNLIGLHVTGAKDQVADLLAKLSGYFSGFGSGTALGRSVGTLASIVQREANVLAYIDGFWIRSISRSPGCCSRLSSPRHRPAPSHPDPKPHKAPRLAGYVRFPIQDLKVLNQPVTRLIQPAKILNQHLNVLIQLPNTLNQRAKTLIQAVKALIQDRRNRFRLKFDSSEILFIINGVTKSFESRAEREASFPDLSRVTQTRSHSRRSAEDFRLCTVLQAAKTRALPK